MTVTLLTIQQIKLLFDRCDLFQAYKDSSKLLIAKWDVDSHMLHPMLNEKLNSPYYWRNTIALDIKYT